ncbi:hypothetical protein DNTS_006233, partial [Danionella cerebrum]
AASELVEDVKRGDGERYGAEKLVELCKLLPDKEEEARLQNFPGDRSALPEPDLFILLLVEIPSFRMRLDVMILRQEFDPAVTSLCTAARCLREAARELLSCPELHYILRLVLKAGNYMNAGGYAGNAAGFRISSLLKLADTKANKPGMNLLHFVAMEAVKKDKDLLMFSSRLSHVSPASRLSEESVIEEFSRLQSRVADLRIRVQADSKIQQQTRTFLEGADVRLKEAQDELESLEQSSKALVEFFCEDDKSFKLEEACHIFQCFCHRFQRAVQENTERALQEQRRVTRERENVEKRRSLALCTGLQAERDSDDLEHALQRSLSYTGSRRSLRRLSKFFQHAEERNAQFPTDSTFHPEGLGRESELKIHPLQRTDAGPESNQQGMRFDKPGPSSLADSKPISQQDTVTSDSTLKSRPEMNLRTVPSALGKTSIASHQQGAVNVMPLTGLSPDKVKKPVQDTTERLTQIARDVSEVSGKKDCVRGKDCPSLKGVTTPETATNLVGDTWSSMSSPPESIQRLSLETRSPEREHVYPRVGETVECHTLVRGLRTYESNLPAMTRPATSHCSKWMKEREAEDRDSPSTPHTKDDLRMVKTPTRAPAKRVLIPRGGPSNNSGIPRVRTKPEAIPSDGLSAGQLSRSSPARPRTSVEMRLTGVQNQVKTNASARQKSNSQSDSGTDKGNGAEKSNKDKCREPFVRGSPLRVTKRVAPNSESQIPLTIHTPTAATTAKTIRTAIISAAEAKAKTAKSSVTRLPGPRVPRATSQPMWR